MSFLWWIVFRLDSPFAGLLWVFTGEMSRDITNSRSVREGMRGSTGDHHYLKQIKFKEIKRFEKKWELMKENHHHDHCSYSHSKTVFCTNTVHVNGTRSAVKYTFDRLIVAWLRSDTGSRRIAPKGELGENESAEKRPKIEDTSPESRFIWKFRKAILKAVRNTEWYEDVRRCIVRADNEINLSTHSIKKLCILSRFFGECKT